MKKSLLFGVLLLSLIFVGVTSVSALEYKGYKKGDKIEVMLNKNLSANFYVIEDSSSDSDIVTAIYEGVLGDMFWFNPVSSSINGSTAETKLKELTKEWMVDVRLIKAEEIKKDLKISSKEEYEFKEPNYYHIGKSYWTQTVVKDGESYFPYVVTNWNSFSNLHATIDKAPASGGYIRPVIEVQKNFIKDGITDSPRSWQELAEGFQKFLNRDIINVKYDGKGLIVKNIDLDETIFIRRENNRIIGNFDNENNSYISFDLFRFICFNNPLLSMDIVDENGKLIKEIHTKYLDATLDEEEGPTSYSIDLNHYLGFKDETVKNDNNTSDVVNNPKTGDIKSNYLILAILGATLLISISIKKLKRIKK